MRWSHTYTSAGKHGGGGGVIVLRVGGALRGLRAILLQVWGLEWDWWGGNEGRRGLHMRGGEEGS